MVTNIEKALELNEMEQIAGGTNPAAVIRRGAEGAAIGAGAGAAGGSFVPAVGTVAGGMIGSAIGCLAGLAYGIFVD